MASCWKSLERTSPLCQIYNHHQSARGRSNSDLNCTKLDQGTKESRKRKWRCQTRWLHCWCLMAESIPSCWSQSFVGLQYWIWEIVLVRSVWSPSACLSLQMEVLKRCSLLLLLTTRWTSTSAFSKMTNYWTNTLSKTWQRYLPEKRMISNMLKSKHFKWPSDRRLAGDVNDWSKYEFD